MNKTKYLATLCVIILTVGCREIKPPRTGIPNCPPPHLVVKIKNGSISGQDLENLIENHIQDHICIEKLKALLGKKFKKPKGG